MVVAQGQILAFKLHDGLAAAGYITLAVTLTRYIDRADQIITATIYPAICAIQNQRAALEELYVKSNRATLMWVLPYAVGIVLFAPDLVHFVLGDQWEPAVVLLQGLAVVGAITQLGFNWFSFFRAHGETRPPGGRGARRQAAFLVLAVPGLLLDGFDGFVYGRIGAAVVALAVRSVYMRGLLGGVRYRALLTPTLLPLALRLRRGAGAALGAVGRPAHAGPGARRAGAVRRRLRDHRGPSRAPASGRAVGGAAGDGLSRWRLAGALSGRLCRRARSRPQPEAARRA